MKYFEIPRKTVHILSLLVPLAAYYALLPTQMVLLFFSAFYGYSEWRKIKGLPFFAHPYIGAMHRDEERAGWAPAPLFLAVGCLVSITFFRWEAFFIGIYQAGFCDTVAALCGKRWGKTKIPFFSRKTVVGSAAFFVAALPVALIFLSPAQAVVLCLAGAYLESLPFKDLDNLTVPVIITFLAHQFLIR